MNNYQKALNNLKFPTDEWESNELQLAENNDMPIEYKEQESIDLLQELVDKATPKKAIKLKQKEHGYTHECPTCHKYVGTIVYDDVEHDDYCCSCGQRLDWGNEDETN